MLKIKKIKRRYINKCIKTKIADLDIKQKTKVYEHRIDRERSLTRCLKNEVLERDNNRCHYCGRYGDTIDHKKPLCKGGKSTLENCVCSCEFCNNKKGDMDYNQFISLLKKFNKSVWLDLREEWMFYR